jgi:4-hydroxy-tetrahydrodipicolinate synthase
VAFAAKCKTYGAAAVVAAPPYYFKLTQAECMAWFTEMADRLPLPLVVYDMPAHTDTVIEPATIAKLAAHPNIVAMKDSSSIIALFNKFRIALEPFADKFSLFMGPDEAMGEAVLLGADGGVCTGANLWPAQFKAMYLAAKAGDVETVRRLQRFTTTSSYLLYGLGQGQIGFLKGVKCALAEMGLIQNVLAAPFAPFTGRERAQVKAALGKLMR